MTIGQWVKSKPKTECILFFACALLTVLALLAFFLSLLIYGTQRVDPHAVLPQFATDFGDFFDVLNFVKDRDPYSDAPLYGDIANYPPLGYAIFYLFSLIPGLAGQEMNARSPLGLVAMLLYLLLFTVPVGVTLYRRLNKFGRFTRVLFLCALFTSYPFYFCVMRMNMNLMSAFFAFYFIVWYKEENKAKRYLSLVCLAVAGLTKIYPLFLGVLLLRDRRWKDVLLTAGLGILLFFLPFLLFKGGFSDIGRMLSYMTEFSAETGGFNRNDMAFAKMLRAVLLVFGVEAGGTLSAGIGAMKFLLFFVSCAALFFTKNNFKFTLLATVAFLNLPDLSYTYSLIFLIVPLYVFLTEEWQGKEPTGESFLFFAAGIVVLSYFALVSVLEVLLLFVSAVLLAKGWARKRVALPVLCVSLFCGLVIVYDLIAQLAVGGAYTSDYSHQLSLSCLPLSLQLSLITEAAGEAIARIRFKRGREKQEENHADEGTGGKDPSERPENDGAVGCVAHCEHPVFGGYRRRAIQRCASV